MLLRLLIYKAPAIAWMSLIFLLSSGPVNPSVNEVPDYLLHSAAYAVLYVALFWAVHEGLAPVRGRGGYILPGVITVLYGLSDEFHQSFIPSRDAALHDLLADAGGAIIGAALVAAGMRLVASFAQTGRFGMIGASSTTLPAGKEQKSTGLREVVRDGQPSPASPGVQPGVPGGHTRKTGREG